MSEMEWKSTACCICSNNCGLRVQVKDDRIVKIKGDKKNPFSQGYVCNKGLAVDYYQNHNQRVLSPLRRKADASFEEIDWDTATGEIAGKLKDILAEHGPRSVAFIGGGGQANHLDVPYVPYFLEALGTKYLYNALAQEYTQKYWINGHMFGSEGLDFHGDAHRCDVFLVIGSNPWVSHEIQQARRALNEISKDPKRKLIVVDPRRHETAKKADTFLMIKPGTDVYLFLALINVIVKEGLCDEQYLADKTTGWDEISWIADLVTPEKAATLCDLDADEIAVVARTFAKADSAATHVALGIFHGLHMLESAYLERILLAITGNIGVPGGVVFPESFLDVDPESEGEKWKTRVAGIEEIQGLFPPNALPEEILAPGNDRIRAVIVEGSNPLRSYADSIKYDEAFKVLDLLVVIDPAMSETARLAHYVLPAKCGYEKFETALFPMGFPGIYVHLRQPVVKGPELARQECEIFLDILEKMDVDVSDLLPFAILKPPRDQGEPHPVLSLIGGFSMMFAMKHRDALINNGIITGSGDDTSELMKAILDHPEGLYLCDTYDENNLEHLQTEDKKIHLVIPKVPQMLEDLEIPDAIDLATDRDFPFILQTGERTNSQCNTIQRDHDWRRATMPTSYLRMNEKDAERLEIADGETVRLVTETTAVSIDAMVTDDIYPGSVSTPHGFGLIHTNKETGELEQIGVNANELISADRREPMTGNPIHKYNPCRIEKQ
jgi:anaerobic selenocysteine-containing dehydrogenase